MEIPNSLRKLEKPTRAIIITEVGVETIVSKVGLKGKEENLHIFLQ